MSEYIISCDNRYSPYYDLLLNKIRGVQADIGVELSEVLFCGRRYAHLQMPDHAAESVIALVHDLMTDVVLIHHKNRYFRDHLNVGLSDKALKNLYYTAVTMYDSECDAELLRFSRISRHELAVDGVFRFCLTAVHSRWKSVRDILTQNFVDDSDRDAVIEFIKHIVFSAPGKLTEVNIYSKGGSYRFVDGNGRVLGDVEIGAGELAARLMYVSPNVINVHDLCDNDTAALLKNVFSDRVHFYC